MWMLIMESFEMWMQTCLTIKSLKLITKRRHGVSRLYEATQGSV